MTFRSRSDVRISKQLETYRLYLRKIGISSHFQQLNFTSVLNNSHSTIFISLLAAFPICLCILQCKHFTALSERMDSSSNYWPRYNFAHFKNSYRIAKTCYCRLYSIAISYHAPESPHVMRVRCNRPTLHGDTF